MVRWMREHILFYCRFTRHSCPCCEGWQANGDGSHCSCSVSMALALGRGAFFTVDFIAVAAAPQAEKSVGL